MNGQGKTDWFERLRLTQIGDIWTSEQLGCGDGQAGPEVANIWIRAGVGVVHARRELVEQQDGSYKSRMQKVGLKRLMTECSLKTEVLDEEERQVWERRQWREILGDVVVREMWVYVRVT